uniref:Potassium calcium-activated channel subfamily M regulatory beta subunit 2 n=1 Tax=Scleropages formosus TaxID=113540 RepID=A0A8C9R7S0_SCLFO
MFLWAGSKGTPESETIYQKIWEAILLGLTMILFSIMMYFITGITVVRSYLDSVWTEESSCAVVNSTITGEMNCTYSYSSDCKKSLKYPCLQVFVTLNASGKVMRLFYNEETRYMNLEVSPGRKLTCKISFPSKKKISLLPQVRCYYDRAEHQDSVLLTQLYSRGMVFWSLLWPTIMFIGGTIIIALVKLTQYLSLLCEEISRIKR